MSCELTECCQFFADKMESFPKAAEYIKLKLCLGDYASCNRFKIYKEFGGENIPLGLDPDDTEEVQKILLCLRKKRLHKGEQRASNLRLGPKEKTGDKLVPVLSVNFQNKID